MKQRNYIHLAIVVLMLFNLVHYAQCVDPCLTYYDAPGTSYCKKCDTATNPILVRIVMSDGIICGVVQSDATCLPDAYYGVTYTSRSFVSELIESTNEVICHDCLNLDANCASCATLPSTISDNLKKLIKITYGCTACTATTYAPTLVLDTNLGLYRRGCKSTLIAAESQCNWAQTYTATATYGAPGCVDCNTIMNNCAGCVKDAGTAETYTCQTCLANHYLGMLRDKDWNQVTQCYYKFCGYQGTAPDLASGSTTCKACTTGNNCQICQFDIAGTETCVKCNLGYYLNGAGACIIQTGTANPFNIYVQSTTAYLFDGTQDGDMTSRSGASIAEAYYFLQQAFNYINTIAPTYSSQLTVNIWIGKGDHFFFYCSPDWASKWDATTYNFNVTHFCDYTSLQAQYPKYDNVEIHMGPLHCDNADYTASFSSPVFTGFCSDFTSSSTPKPMIIVNSPTAYFNVTNSLYIERLQFTGVNAFAVQTGAGPLNNNMWEFPLLQCQITSSISGVQNAIPVTTVTQSGFPVPFSCTDTQYSTALAQIPMDTTKCSTAQSQYQSQARCGGEPYSDNFFKTDSTTGYAFQRRKTLFNLYAFDQMHSTLTTPPLLSINLCDFTYFLVNYESLINVETNNFFYHGNASAGYLSYQGDHRGAQIYVTSSTFKHSRFCKGLIVYRETMIMTYKNFVNVTMQGATDKKNAALNKDTKSKLTISSSTFLNLNWGSITTHIQKQNDFRSLTMKSTGVEQTVLAQTGILFYAFQHKGIVLNFEDFKGGIEFKSCTFDRNFIFIPDIYISEHLTTDTYDLSQFYSSTYNEYAFAYCDPTTGKNKYLMDQGFDFDYNIETLFVKFERLGLIYTSRNRDTMIFYMNTFKKNIGTFGGAITVNSPDFTLGIKPYVIISYNTFEQNMAYFSGNAVYVRSTKITLEVQEICAGVYIEQSQFTSNFGMKKHNGGAVTIGCDLISDETTKDYYHSSSFINLYIIFEMFKSLNDPIVDLLDDQTTYQVFMFAVGIMNSQFDQNYSGMKGTAIYLRQISKIIIAYVDITNNAPVYAFQEMTLSPYFTYLSAPSGGRTISYYHPNEDCVDEFLYIEACASSGAYIDHPQVQGALNIENCIDASCESADVLQSVVIQYVNFQNNDAGPILSPRQTHLRASSLYIGSGMNNIILNTAFYQHTSNFNYQGTKRSRTLGNFMPLEYFSYQQAPIIRVKVEPVAPLGLEVVTFSTQFVSSKFYSNRHYQVTGQSTSALQYKGAMIEYTSNMASVGNTLAKLTIKSCFFNDNIFLGPSAALIYIESAQLNILSNTFQYNGYLSDTVVAKTPGTNLAGYFPYTAYSFAKAQSRGMFYVTLSSKHIQSFNPLSAALPSNQYGTFDSNAFLFNFAQQSTAYYIKSTTTNSLMFVRNTYDHHYANKGSVIQTNLQMDSTSKQFTLNFTSEKISNQYNSQDGTMSFLSNANQQVAYMKDVSFKNCNGLQGSAIYSQAGGTIYCKTCSISNYYNQYTNKTLYAMTYYKGALFVSTYVKLDYLATLSNIVSLYGTIFLDSSQNQVIGNVLFSGTVIADLQGAYKQYSRFIDCSFTNLTAKYGSVLYSSNSSAMFQNTIRNDLGSYIASRNNATFGTFYLTANSQTLLDKFTIRSSNATFGSGVYLQSSNFTATNTSFKNNTALDKGTIYSLNNGNFSCNQCNISYNVAQGESSVLFAMNNLDSILNISNSDISMNNSTASTIKMLYSNALITNTTITDNVATKVSHGMTLINSQLIASNVTINYTDPLFLNTSTTLSPDSGFFNLNYQSTLTLQNNSTIENCRGKIAAVVYATGSSNFYARSGTKFLNSYSESGYVLSLLSTDTVSLNHTTFSNNKIINIYINSATLSVNNSIFELADQEFIYGDSAKIYINNVTMKDSINQNLNGLGLYCNCYGLNITNSNFTNMSSALGGALYITALKGSDIYIKNSSFSKNIAQQGGAVYISQANNITFENNTFTDNSANIINPPTQYSTQLSPKGMGGAVYFACTTDGLLNCNVTFQSNNTICNNSAETEGGAISWTNSRYNDDGTTVYCNNIASYGSNVASFANRLRIDFVTSNDQSLKTRRLLQSSDKFNIISGRPFAFNVTILDQDGSVYGKENVAKAVLEIVNPSSNSTLTGNIQQARNGVFIFENTIVTIKPGNTVDLKLVINDLSTYSNDINFLSSPIHIDMATRLCVSGEAYTRDYTCEICPIGKYLFVPPMNFTECKDCDPHAICQGGDIVWPVAGYWRSSSSSENFIECPRKKSCLVGNANNKTGVCSTGYNGNVCGVCNPGYSKTSNFDCGRCPEKIKNVVKIAFVLIIAILIVFFLVRSTLSSASKTRPIYSVYLKILANHFQIIGAISSINFHWPEEINQIVNTQQQVAGVSDQIFSFDCFFMGDDDDQETGSIRVYYMKLIFYALLPLILFVTALGYWSIHSLVYKNFYKLKQNLTSSIVVLLFLVHPSISKMMFSSLNCMKIDDKLMLMADVHEQCFSGKHKVFLIILAIPSILVWAIGIPLLALVLLLRHRQTILHIESQDTQSKADRFQIIKIKTELGFLFNGYKLQTFYWEIVIIYRKVFIVMITVFLSRVSSQTQVLVSLVVIIISMLLHMKMKPYYTKVLNQMETFSLVVCVVTMYSGLFYVTGIENSYMDNDGLKWFFFVCVISPNLVFFYFWLYHMRLEILKMMIESKRLGLFRLLTCGRITVDKFVQQHMNDDAFLKENGSEDDEDKDKYTENLEEKMGDSGLGVNLFGNQNGGDRQDVFKSKKAIRIVAESGSATRQKINHDENEGEEVNRSNTKRQNRYLQGRGGQEEMTGPAQVQLEFNEHDEVAPQDVNTNRPIQKHSKVAPLDKLYNLEFLVSNQRYQKEQIDVFSKSKDEMTVRNLLMRPTIEKEVPLDSFKKTIEKNKQGDQLSQKAQESEDRKIQKLDTRSKMQTSMRKTFQKEIIESESNISDDRSDLDGVLQTLEGKGENKGLVDFNVDEEGGDKKWKDDQLMNMNFSKNSSSVIIQDNQNLSSDTKDNRDEDKNQIEEQANRSRMDKSRLSRKSRFVEEEDLEQPQKIVHSNFATLENRESGDNSKVEKPQKRPKDNKMLKRVTNLFM